MRKKHNFIVFETKAKNIQIDEIERKLFTAIQNIFTKDCDVYISVTKKDLSNKNNLKLYISNHNEIHSDYMIIGKYKSCNFHAVERTPLASAIQKLIKKIEDANRS